MHITAICPGCGTSYQVSPTLRGQPMRCPRRECASVFTVGAAAAAPPAPPPPPPPPATSKTQRSGTVGDMVPILSAEAAVPPKPPKTEPTRSQTVHVSDIVPLIQAEVVDMPPPKPADAPSWQSAPPPRRSANGVPHTNPTAPPPTRIDPSEAVPVEEIVVAEVEEEVVADFDVDVLEVLDPAAPVELPPGQWEPPPVRRGAGCDTAVQNPDVVPEDHAIVSTKTRRSRWLIAGMMLAMFVVVVIGGGVAYLVLRDTEERLWTKTQDEYKKQQYGHAAELAQQLCDKFQTSGRRDEYAYFKQLCELRSRLGTGNNPAEELADLQKFFDEHNKDEPYFKQYGADFGEAARKALADFIANPPIDDTTPAAVDNAEKLIAAIQTALGDKAKPEETAKLAEAFPSIRKQHADWLHRTEVVKHVEELARTPTADALREAKRYLRAEEAQLPGLSQLPEVTRVLDEMRAGHLASVVYLPNGEDQPKPGPREDYQPSILVGAAGEPEDKVVLALARGVLYALRPSDGKAAWAIRVGIDTIIPPVRVPPIAGNPELILVLSADTETVIALENNGQERWRYRLSKPCLGRPVVIDQRAFLPTYDGQVHVIELIKGGLIGRYQLGQRLTCGAVREGKTSRLYFPADDSCVYVLNVADQKCEAILYSEHPADSLRGEPLIVASKSDPEQPSGYLLLTQKQPLDDVQLRVFELPIKPGKTGERKLEKAPRLPGWTWFPPQYDGEKVALVSDAGVLGLFGVHQERTRDEPLFPYFRGADALKLDRFFPAAAKAKVRGRAEVVQVQGDDFWVLAHGSLQRLQRVWDGEKGLRLVGAWPAPIPIGEPLHASQVESDRTTGRGTLFIVSQGLMYPTCQATAIEDETGEIRWRRQLGMVSQGEPLLLNAGAGPGLVLALDQAGGLFVFDPKRFDPRNVDQWQSGGKAVAAPLPRNPQVPPMLLRGPDGESAFEIACPGDGQELVIRQARVEEQRQVNVRERRLKLEAPLAGTPAFVGPTLVLPLADGNLYRVPWKQLDKPLDPGEEWRGGGAAADALGHVVALGDDFYLCTNGSRGLNVFHGPDKKWTLEMKDRILAAPLVVPPAPAAAAGALGVWTVPNAGRLGVELCVADTGGVVSLLVAGGNGSLTVKREWSLKGRITAGPFVRQQTDGPRIGCVVETGKGERRLVWIDPEEKDICWQGALTSELVGQPELIEGLLVIVEANGQYRALDPRTGQPTGPGYLLKGSMAPAAAPVAFGPKRLFAPLSDGTVLLLSMNQLEQP